MTQEQFKNNSWTSCSMVSIHNREGEYQACAVDFSFEEIQVKEHGNRVWYSFSEIEIAR